MGKSPTKILTTQATYFFAAVLVYTKLEVRKLKCGIGHFRLKAQLYTVGLKAMCQQLTLLRAQHLSCLKSRQKVFVRSCRAFEDFLNNSIS